LFFAKQLEKPICPMASAALAKWRDERARSLDEMVRAHQMIGGTGRGRRFATQQLNHAYAVLLSSQFQAFCRDLHTECLIHIVRNVQPAYVAQLLKAEFSSNRKLDKGNPNPGNIGNDFNRFGVDLWDVLKKRYAGNTMRHDCLIELNIWRNAIAHNDFSSDKLGGRTELYLYEVRRWRNACDRLAQEMETVLGNHLTTVMGVAPW
jgi:hypothetical protein